MTARRILLTGATGTLGSRLASALAGLGHELVVIKRRSSDLARLSAIRPQPAAWDVEDLDLPALFKRHGPVDDVVHTATCYGRRNEPVDEIFELNEKFPFRLLQAAAAHGVGRFYNFDTILPRDVNNYALSKGRFLEAARAFIRGAKIGFVNVRLEHVYGPGDADSKFATHVIKSCLKNAPELKFTPGDQKRDFIFIDDAIDAFLRIWTQTDESSGKFRQYEVGTGKAVSIRSFAELVKRITGSATQLNFGALPYRENEMMDCRLDIAPLKALGWYPRVDLETGIKLTAKAIESELAAKP